MRRLMPTLILLLLVILSTDAHAAWGVVARTGPGQLWQPRSYIVGFDYAPVVALALPARSEATYWMEWDEALHPDWQFRVRHFRFRIYRTNLHPAATHRGEVP